MTLETKPQTAESITLDGSIRSPSAIRPVPGKAELGQAGAEVLAIAVIVGVGLILLFANVWTVVDAKMKASDSARDIARELVEAPVGQINQDGATAILAKQNWKAGSLVNKPTVLLVSPTGKAERCSRVTVAVTVRIRAVGLPFAKHWSKGFTVGARHSEIIDPFRSDPELEGDGLCAA